MSLARKAGHQRTAPAPWRDLTLSRRRLRPDSATGRQPSSGWRGWPVSAACRRRCVPGTRRAVDVVRPGFGLGHDGLPALLRLQRRHHSNGAARAVYGDDEPGPFGPNRLEGIMSDTPLARGSAARSAGRWPGRARRSWSTTATGSRTRTGAGLPTTWPRKSLRAAARRWPRTPTRPTRPARPDLWSAPPAGATRWATRWDHPATGGVRLGRAAVVGGCAVAGCRRAGYHPWSVTLRALCGGPGVARMRRGRWWLGALTAAAGVRLARRLHRRVGAAGSGGGSAAAASLPGGPGYVRRTSGVHPPSAALRGWRRALVNRI